MTNRRLLIFCLLTFFFVGGASAINAENLMIGARPLALGKAFVGLADDGSAIFSNPAGLARIKFPQLVNSYATPFPQNSIIVLSGSLPDLYGVPVGMGYINNTISGMVMQLPNTVEVNYTAQEFLLGFASDLTDRLSLGLGLDILTKSYSNNSALLAGNRGSGMDMSLGLHYRPKEELKLGLNLQNILPASLGGKFTYDSGVTEALPANLKAGLSWSGLRNTIFNFDLDKQLEKISPILAHFGVEWQLAQMISIRAGLDQVPQSPDAISSYTNLTTGIGFRFRGITFDYTSYKYSEPGKITNLFSIGYSGEGAPTRSFTVEARPVTVSPETSMRRVARARFSDVNDLHPAREAIELMATTGLFSGFPDGTFKPEADLTRLEFTEIMAQARHVVPSEIKESRLLISRSEAVNYFQRNNLGLTESKLPPGKQVTRADLAIMLLNTPLGQAAVKRLH